MRFTQVGDKVIFDRYSGAKIEFGGGEFLVVKEEDLLGRITGEAGNA